MSHEEDRKPIGQFHRSQTQPITEIEIADRTNQSDDQSNGKSNKPRVRRSSIVQFRSIQPHDYTRSKSGRSINQPVPSINSPVNHLRYDKLKSNPAELAAESQNSRSLLEWLWRAIPSAFKSAPPRSSFARVISTSTRATLSFIVASCLIVQDWSLMVWGIAYLFLIHAGVFMTSTVGLSIQLCEMQVRCTLVSCIIDTILIATTVGFIENETHRIVAIELLLFVTTIGLCYFFTNPIERRQALVLHAIIMVAMAQGRVTYQYPSQIFAGYVSAAVLTILLVALPFPRLAKDEILDRWLLSVQTLSRDFSKLTEAFLVQDSMRPRVIIALVRDDLSTIFDQISAIRKLQPATRYESSIWHLLFPKSIYYGSIVRADPDNLEQMYWIVSNLCDTIERIEHPSVDHRNVVKRAGAAFDSFQALQTGYIKLLTKNAGDDLSINQAVHTSHEELTDAFHKVEDCFVEGRIVNLKSISRRIPRNKDADPLLIQHANDELYTHNLVMFYYSRWFHHLHTMTVDPLITDTFSEHTGKPCMSLARPLKQLQFTRAWSSQFERPQDWTFIGMRPLSDFMQFLRSTRHFVRHPSVDVRRLKSAVKIAWIICCASLFAVIPQINNLSVLPNAQWTVITTAYLVSDTSGMLWNRCIQRLLGTCTGGLVGYLIVVAFPQSWEGSMSLLCLWFFMTQIISGFPRFAYFGLMNAFTAVVVVVGKRQSSVGARLSTADYTLERMIEISIGILIYLLFSSILWPDSSIRMLRSEMIVAINACDSATAASADIFSRIVEHENQIEQTEKSHTGAHSLASDFVKENAASMAGIQVEVSPSHANRVNVTIVDGTAQDEMLRQLLLHSSTVRASLSLQDKYLFDAITEPIAILIPVPEQQYRTLMSNVRRCWKLVLTMEPALRQVLIHQVAEAVAHPKEHNETIKRIGVFNGDIRILIAHIHTLFALCNDMLRSGNPNTASSSAELIAATIANLRNAQFELTLRLATSFEDAQPDAHGRHAALLGTDSVPMTVFVYITQQLAMEALILELHIRKLLKLERPVYYDDR